MRSTKKAGFRGPRMALYYSDLQGRVPQHTLDVRDDVHLRPPRSPFQESPWNCTAIFRGFLFLGAGYDARGRSLLLRKGDPPRASASRIEWYRRRGVGFCLNMAGSGKQHELRGAEYPDVPGGRPLECERVDLNDTDEPVKLPRRI